MFDYNVTDYILHEVISLRVQYQILSFLVIASRTVTGIRHAKPHIGTAQQQYQLQKTVMFLVGYH